MSHQSSIESDGMIPSHPLDSKNPHPSKDTNFEEKQEDPFLLRNQNHDVTQNQPVSKTILCNKETVASKDVEEKVLTTTSVNEVWEEESERERLKRHRVEVAGRVWIPEIWGQEELLKDWIDCSAFDAPLVPSKITMARAALVEDGTRANAAALSIDNRDMEFNVNKDLSLNNNCTNVDVQNTRVFRHQEEQLNKKI